MGPGACRVQDRGIDQPLTRSRRADLVGLTVVVAVVVIDQLTKNWALASFALTPRHVVWTLQFVVTRNTGTAFSLLSGRGIGPAIALVAVVVVVIVIRTLRFVKGWPAAIGSGLVIGGALGNIADRVFRAHGAGFLQGAVVDWIDFQWWPVFNVADASITVGAVMLAVAAFLAPEATGEPEGEPESAGSGRQDR